MASTLFDKCKNIWENITTSGRRGASILGTERLSIPEYAQPSEFRNLIIWKFEWHHIVTMSIASLLFMAAVCLFRQATIISVLNALYLTFSAIMITGFEIYQPMFFKKFAQFWNHHTFRGSIMLWLSVTAVPGSKISGILAMLLSMILIFVPFIFAVPELLPILHVSYDEINEEIPLEIH